LGPLEAGPEDIWFFFTQLRLHGRPRLQAALMDMNLATRQEQQAYDQNQMAAHESTTSGRPPSSQTTTLRLPEAARSGS
jgi:hypothetical protein